VSINEVNITETIESAKEVLSSDKTVSPQVRALMQLLIVIVQLLVNKLGLNSRNSSKPPSTDPNRPRVRRSKTGGVKRKPGGQPGHKGRQIEQVASADVVETLDIDRTTLPKGHRYQHVGYDKRQVIDIIVKREVTEYRAEVVRDERGNEYVAEFPARVKRPAQYGPELKAKAVYMSQAQLIPYERAEEFFRTQCGITVSTGSLFNFNKQAYEGLEAFETFAREKLIASELLHNDETGINIGGKLRWLHSASNEKWTLFFAHEKRGGEAMEAMGILPHFKGISVHDHWKPYLTFKCLHALCNSHHLRELERAWEQDGEKWAKNMQRLLEKINLVVNQHNGKLTEKKAELYLKKYRALITRANRECPEPERKGPIKRGRIKKSKARNLLERLRDYETEVLRFMTDSRVPFTNNLSERDIRMTKVQQKISGCFRSIEGARIFCRVRSYLSTCRKHGVEPAEALRLLFVGKFPSPLRISRKSQMPRPKGATSTE
jgi:transposase